MKIGDQIDVKGPKGRFVYKKNQYKHIGMIAGGTGITPMLQIITEILKRSDDDTIISLIFGNVTYEDIILRDHLNALAKKHTNAFNLYYVLDKPPKDWDMGSGFITSAMIKQQFPGPDKDNFVLLCGPVSLLCSCIFVKNFLLFFFVCFFVF
jgi:cytochrome-b5 reductase